MKKEIPEQIHQARIHECSRYHKSWGTDNFWVPGRASEETEEKVHTDVVSGERYP